MTVIGRTHRPVVDNQLCQRCSVCVRACPAETFGEFRSEDGTARGYVYTNTDLLTREILPPCEDACPITQQVRRYVQLLEAGNTKEALLVIRQDNPLPAVCGYVCHHPCEEACVRGSWDEPVAIRELKRHAVHYEMEYEQEVIELLREQRKPARKKKVVIVGAGPAGLACGYELVMEGYVVSIMDALDQPGGMLVGGIPPFRLPRPVVEHDVHIIQSLGVEFVGSTRLDHDFTIGDVRKADADAMVLATGAWRDLSMGVPGEDAKGYFECLEFLREVNAGRLRKLTGTVLVIGGGNAALDTARNALRLDPERVIVMYRRSREEMPASSEELEDALREGVMIRYLEAPTRIIVEAGHVRGVELMEMELGDIDDTGRRRPIPREGSGFSERADTIIAAIGQRPELSFLEPTAITGRGTVWCDETGLVHGYEGVFAAGDAVSGPSTIVEAIASGKAVAHMVMNYLDGK
jgi:NADPH-dependent glutamate synthase beta subunit-like oxidoreductase